jgi:hypothetical protein
MQGLLFFIIFAIIAFLYIHIIHQFKTSEDMEIYEMDYSTNTHLQTICDVKQPVLFSCKEFLGETIENLVPQNVVKNGGSYDVKVKDTKDYTGVETVDYVVFPLQTTQKLLKNDAGSHYYTENNDDFIEESGLAKTFHEMDEYFKPTFVLQTKYDYMLGSSGTCSPLRYHNYYRHFCVVVSGKIQVKMTPWKGSKYLKPIRDYETYEFRSTTNPWKSGEDDKIKYLEFDVDAGNVLYIPSYWWYSIKFSDNSAIACATYNSVMNIFAHAQYWGRYFLQQANIRKKMAKTIEMSEGDGDPVDEKAEVLVEENVVITDIM